MAAKKDLKAIPRRLPAGSPSGGLPGGYLEFLEDIKTRVREAQVRASLAAHRELIDLYWYVGKSIVQRQKAEGWGQSIVERFSRDMQTAFPGIEGFSRQNIWKMHGFYLAYTEGVSNLSQAVRDLDGTNLPSDGDTVGALRRVACGVRSRRSPHSEPGCRRPRRHPGSPSRR